MSNMWPACQKTWHIILFTRYLARVAYAFQSIQVPKPLKALVSNSGLAMRITAVYIPLDIWIQYCNLNFKEIKYHQSHQIVLLFVLYVTTVDAYIDSDEGRKRFAIRPSIVRTEYPFRNIISELTNRILQTNTSKRYKRLIVTVLRQFFKEAIKTSHLNTQDQLKKQKPSLPSLFSYRWRTSGAMYGTFACVLNLTHNLPIEKGKSAEKLLTLWGVAVQVLDDLLDVVWDYQKDPNNVVWVLLEQHPEERLEVEALLTEKMCFIPSHLAAIAPRTYKHLQHILEDYLSQMTAIDPKNQTILRTVTNVRSAFTSLTSPLAEYWVWALLYFGKR